MFRKTVERLLSIGVDSSDSPALKIKKSTLLIVPLIIAPLAVIWGSSYIYFEHYISAFIPLTYSLVSIFNLLHLHKTKNIFLLQKMQMLLVLFLPFILMWSLGGFALGSFVFIWAFYAPIASLMDEDSNSLYWFYSFFFLVALSILLDSSFIQEHTGCLPFWAIELFYFLNITAGLSGVYFLIQHFISEKNKNADSLLKKEHQKLLEKTQELNILNEKLHDLAVHDSLTGLANRYLLRKTLIKMLALAKRQEKLVGLFFLDLDGFKNINDKYGHAAGDAVLKAVGERLKPLLREEDFIARIGGDEFAIAITNITDKEFVNHISQRMISEISQDYENIKSEDSISVSIGISFFPDDGIDIDTLINNADEAMYKVKQSGKNNFKVY
ncbi:diguanylate cyclase [Sulfurimonas sp. SAG-AH-194-C20]|nr:diguanylate cyclase [Sulfurimonas sp. SAG-AH-194-C20]MDF1878356.1 diguanylate cyclase [Sulfurimonas sp. SAG-AH-194-C20]